MAHFLDLDFVSRYARGPAESTVNQAVSLHQAVRGVLGEDGYATLLQGSYKNATALYDVNDVDISAVDRSLASRTFGTAVEAGVGVEWNEIFARIERILDADTRYRGKWERKDKCIQVNMDIHLDIVPAVRVGNVDTDPIAIYSFREGRERLNWPRLHVERAAAKSRETNGMYKIQVRLFKRWRKCWWSDSKVAPSYYLECALHAAPSSLFDADPARAFLNLSQHLVKLQYGASTVPRIAGEGNLLSTSEWPGDNFRTFRERLSASSVDVARALGAPNAGFARDRWVAAFNGQSAT